MLPPTKRKSKPVVRRGPTRFRGICSDAKALGVDRVTLYRALTGERPDLTGLIRRYWKMKEDA